MKSDGRQTTTTARVDGYQPHDTVDQSNPPQGTPWLGDDYPTTKDESKECENCHFYHMIDSGYGWCTRYPPRIAYRLVVRFLIFLRLVRDDSYSIVPWNMKGCGEHKARSLKSRENP